MPPAEITTSAWAISDWASIACGGDDEAGNRAQLGALGRGAGQDDDLHSVARGGVAGAGEHVREQVVGEAVIQRHLRRRADDRDRALRIERQLGEDRRIGLEVGEVVLLLQTRIRANLAVRAVGLQALPRDRVGHDDRSRQAAVDVMLDRCPLVVEHRRRRDPQRRGRDGDVIGPVPERDVKACAAGGANVGQGPAHERGRARRQASELGGQPLAAMAPDRCVVDVQALAQLERLREVARGHTHVVAVRAQALDHGAHDEHVRTVRKVDPDSHGRTGRPGRPATGTCRGGRSALPQTCNGARHDHRPDAGHGIVGRPMLVLASISETLVNETSQLRARSRPARDIRADGDLQRAAFRSPRRS